MKIYKFAINLKSGERLRCVIDRQHFVETISQLLLGGHEYTWEETDVAPLVAAAILHPSQLPPLAEGDLRNV